MRLIQRRFKDIKSVFNGLLIFFGVSDFFAAFIPNLYDTISKIDKIKGIKGIKKTQWLDFCLCYFLGKDMARFVGAKDKGFGIFFNGLVSIVSVLTAVFPIFIFFKMYSVFFHELSQLKKNKKYRIKYRITLGVLLFLPFSIFNLFWIVVVSMPQHLIRGLWQMALGTLAMLGLGRNNLWSFFTGLGLLVALGVGTASFVFGMLLLTHAITITAIPFWAVMTMVLCGAVCLGLVPLIKIAYGIFSCCLQKYTIKDASTSVVSEKHSVVYNAPNTHQQPSHDAETIVEDLKQMCAEEYRSYEAEKALQLLLKFLKKLNLTLQSRDFSSLDNAFLSDCKKRTYELVQYLVEKNTDFTLNCVDSFTQVNLLWDLATGCGDIEISFVGEEALNASIQEKLGLPVEANKEILQKGGVFALS